MKLMYFKALDHCTDPTTNWTELSDLKTDPVEIEVVGFVAKEDETYYFLVQAHGEEQFSACFRLLKSTIIKKKEFKIPK